MPKFGSKKPQRSESLPSNAWLSRRGQLKPQNITNILPLRLFSCSIFTVVVIVYLHVESKIWLYHYQQHQPLAFRFIIIIINWSSIQRHLYHHSSPSTSTPALSADSSFSSISIPISALSIEGIDIIIIINIYYHQRAINSISSSIFTNIITIIIIITALPPPPPSSSRHYHHHYQHPHYHHHHYHGITIIIIIITITRVKLLWFLKVVTGFASRTEGSWMKCRHVIQFRSRRMAAIAYSPATSRKQYSRAINGIQ